MSYVAPCVLHLFRHLEKCSTPCYYVSSMIDTLMESLQRRFQGILINAKLSPGSLTDKTPFAEKLYLISAVLDPQFGVVWLEVDGPQDKSKANAVNDWLECKFYGYKILGTSCV